MGDSLSRGSRTVSGLCEMGKEVGGGLRDALWRRIRDATSLGKRYVPMKVEELERLLSEAEDTIAELERKLERMRCDEEELKAFRKICEVVEPLTGATA